MNYISRILSYPHLELSPLGMKRSIILILEINRYSRKYNYPVNTSSNYSYRHIYHNFEGMLHITFLRVLRKIFKDIFQHNKNFLLIVNFLNNSNKKYLKDLYNFYMYDDNLSKPYYSSLDSNLSKDMKENNFHLMNNNFFRIKNKIPHRHKRHSLVDIVSKFD
jgi:hypothetical protein